MKTTGIFCIVIMIILGIYDGIAVLQGSTMSSISRWIIETGYYSPCFTLLFGCLIGHLFLSMQEPILFLNKDLDSLLKSLDDIKDDYNRDELKKLITTIKNKRNRIGKIV